MSQGVVEGGADALPRFAVELRAVGAAVVLALSGELDYDTAPELRERLDQALDQVLEPAVDRSARPATVVVDCSSLAFCDSTGLNVLLAARLKAEQQGASIRLAALRGHVVRMFEITGAGTVFSVHPDLADALAAA
ncbi:STAS domain-containing protein [Streptacidiphilus carbonis]|jgi:anti-anti-sigma factor|uniref:STAS domain-containing protein n=1 Tax=Streptacidiphilus carbonis TaxID=105422 RepID=UPI0005A71CB2|nr:STAS domain-containing protein [Streptacidiphilus carbonis]